MYVPPSASAHCTPRGGARAQSARCSAVRTASESVLPVPGSSRLALSVDIVHLLKFSLEHKCPGLTFALVIAESLYRFCVAI
ncbi:hypothetical protein OROGR_015855 [Orobanche gracilis]